MLGKTNGGGGGFDPSEIQSGTIAVDNILGLDTLGSIVKGNLAGQYVRVIPAPASTTLTDEQFELFKSGVFINGKFLGLTNPVFFPCGVKGSSYYGTVIGLDESSTQAGRYTHFCRYEISTSTKVISKVGSEFIQFDNTGGIVSFLSTAQFSNLQINSKSWPTYPTTNTTPKVLQIASNGGSLSWGDVPSPAVVAYEGTSLLPTDVVFEDWTLHRAIKDGNVLWIVATGMIKNNSASSVTPTDLFSVTLPSDISSKIYRHDGTTCDQAHGGNPTVLYGNCTSGSSSKRIRIYSSTANTLTIYGESFSSISAGSKWEVDCRIPIFLDTGTVS